MGKEIKIKKKMTRSARNSENSWSFCEGGARVYESPKFWGCKARTNTRKDFTYRPEKVYFNKRKLIENYTVRKKIQLPQ